MIARGRWTRPLWKRAQSLQARESHQFVASRCCRFCLSSLLWILFRFPFDPLEIEYKNRVEDRDQEQGDEGSDGQSADLGIAQWLPQRAAFECERKQSKDRCAHGDQYWANTLNSSIRKSTLQRLTLFVHFLDEVEEHDHMADDDTDQACYAQESHEAKWRVHDGQCNQSSDCAVGGRSKDKQWLDRVVELDEKR